MSQQKFPYQNLSQKNIKGERWKEVPDYEDLYQISNYGRIKSLERWVKRPLKGDFHLKEKILRQAPVKKLNPYTKQLYWTLRVSLCRDARKKLVNTYRLVYCLFVKKFDLSDPTLVVTCKDGNNLNTFWTNLQLTSKSALQAKTYSDQRKRRPEKAVSCYDEKGNLVETYQSIRAAADQLGCSPNSISLALNGAIAHCKGMYWKSGGRKTIKSKGFAYKHVKRIGQYTLTGKLIQQFVSISEAERLTGFNDMGIRDTAMGRRVSYKGFQWKYL